MNDIYDILKRQADARTHGNSALVEVLECELKQIAASLGISGNTRYQAWLTHHACDGLSESFEKAVTRTWQPHSLPPTFHWSGPPPSRFGLYGALAGGTIGTIAAVGILGWKHARDRKQWREKVEHDRNAVDGVTMR